MHYRINQTILSCLILLFTGISIINAQDKNDWSQVYADKYFFSYENSKKSFIIFARKDTMIDIWIEGIRDTARYRKNRYDNSFESEDNGVGYFLERTNNGLLNVSYVDHIFDGNDYQFEYQMKANTFGNITMYDCNQFKQISYWNKLMHDLSPEQIRRFNNTAYYLQQIGDEKCISCAILLLEDIIKVAPKRIVVYLNLADAYWAIEDKGKAIASYNKYIALMKEKGWESKIPKRVYERINKED